MGVVGDSATFRQRKDDFTYNGDNHVFSTNWVLENGISQCLVEGTDTRNNCIYCLAQLHTLSFSKS